jgi:hypothetical protein
MKRAVCLIAIFLACLPAFAKPKPKPLMAERRVSLFGAIGHYIKTHKLMLAADAALFAASAADIHYTERCIHAGTCREAGAFLKGHPSSGELWTEDASLNAGVIVLTNIADHYMRKWNPDDRGFENKLVRSGPSWPIFSISVSHAVAAYNNAQISVHRQPGETIAGTAGKP